MSFSKRYATHIPEGSQRKQEVDAPLVEAPQENSPKRPLEFQKTTEKRFFSREKFLQKKAALKRQEELLKLKRNQASRLNTTPSIEKSALLTIPWKSILVSLIIILCAILGSTAWRFKNQWLFPIRHVEVIGNFTEIDTKNFQKLMTHDTRGSLLLMNPSNLTKALLTLPWVAQAQVERVWPNTVRIHITQKTPVAHFGETQLLDNNGQLFNPMDNNARMHLPFIYGPFDRAAQLLQAYQLFTGILKPLGLSISQLNVSPRLAYTLTLNNGMTLFLGSTDVMAHLQSFAKIYPTTIAPKLDEISYVDMRYTSGMAIGKKT